MAQFAIHCSLTVKLLLMHWSVVYVAYALIKRALLIKIYCYFKYKSQFVLHCKLPTFLTHKTNLIDFLKSTFNDQMTYKYCNFI